MHNSNFTKLFLFFFVIISSTWQQLNTFQLDQSHLIQFFNVGQRDVHVTCYEKRSEGPQMVYLNSKFVRSENDWAVNYGHNPLEDMLFCQFETKVRKWNCAEEFYIPPICVWENKRLVMLRNNLNLPNEEECPPCNEGEGADLLLCDWVIHDKGLYLSQYYPKHPHDTFQFKKEKWGENMLRQENLDEFSLSIINEIDSVVTISFSFTRMLRTIDERLPSRSSAPEEDRTWKKTLNVNRDVHLLCTWLCNFKVAATGQYIRRIKIWTPPNNDPARSPNCIDCAWKLDESGIWLDERGCNNDGPVWVKMYDWNRDGDRDRGEAIAGPSKRPRTRPICEL